MEDKKSPEEVREFVKTIVNNCANILKNTNDEFGFHVVFALDGKYYSLNFGEFKGNFEYLKDN